MLDSLFLYAIILGYIPSFIWLAFILRSDIHPEKLLDIIYTFVLGSAAAVPVILIAVWGGELLAQLNIVLPPLVRQLAFGAILEEVVKTLLIYWVAIRTWRWDEPIDTYIYAGALALGFAGIENVAFGLSYAGGSWQSLSILITFRALTAVFIHIISSFICTYGVVLSYKYQQHSQGIIYVLAGIMIHGLYNTVIGISYLTGITLIAYVYLVLCIPLFLAMVFLVKHLQTKSS